MFATTLIRGHCELQGAPCTPGDTVEAVERARARSWYPRPAVSAVRGRNAEKRLCPAQAEGSTHRGCPDALMAI